MLRYLFQLGNTDLLQQFDSYLEFSFSFLMYSILPLRFQLSCGKCVKYRFIEFFVFDFGSLPYLLYSFPTWELLLL